MLLIYLTWSLWTIDIWCLSPHLHKPYMKHSWISLTKHIWCFWLPADMAAVKYRIKGWVQVYSCQHLYFFWIFYHSNIFENDSKTVSNLLTFKISKYRTRFIFEWDTKKQKISLTRRGKFEWVTCPLFSVLLYCCTWFFY